MVPSRGRQPNRRNDPISAELYGLRRQLTTQRGRRRCIACRGHRPDESYGKQEYQTETDRSVTATHNVTLCRCGPWVRSYVLLYATRKSIEKRKRNTPTRHLYSMCALLDTLRPKRTSTECPMSKLVFCLCGNESHISFMIWP